jgi:hypothetical protein
VAADAASDLAFLAATAKRSIDDLRQALSAVPLDPSRRGASFRAVIDAALDGLEKGIGQRESDFVSAADDTERRAVVRAMRRINLEVMSLHEVTPWIESARGAPVGLGLVYLVDEMVALLLKQSADVVMTPSTTYMYWTYPKPFEDVLTNLGVAYPASNAPVIVAYPIQEPDSLFLHLIIAHELGHSAVTEHKLVQEVLRRDPDRPTTATTLGDAVDEFVTANRVTRAAATGMIRAMVRNWLTELICDGLATAILGPSFLFTAAAFSTPFEPTESSDTHPPFTLRTRLLIERLDAAGWRPLLERAAPSTFNWIETTRTRPMPARAAYFDRLEEALERLAPTIHGVITRHVSGGEFLPAAHDPVEDELARLLDANILPAQLLDRSAVPRRSIILAGWTDSFIKHGDEPEKLAEIVGDRDQQRFLTKGLEMSVILDRWAGV